MKKMAAKILMILTVGTHLCSASEKNAKYAQKIQKFTRDPRKLKRILRDQNLELLEKCETRRFLLNREDRGSVDKTISGQSCVNWDSLPSKSRFGKRRLGRKKYRELGLGDHNFCRNPNDKRASWCFVNAADRTWEFCSCLHHEIMAPTNLSENFQFDLSFARTLTNDNVFNEFLHFFGFDDSNDGIQNEKSTSSTSTKMRTTTTTTSTTTTTTSTTKTTTVSTTISTTTTSTTSTSSSTTTSNAINTTTTTKTSFTTIRSTTRWSRFIWSTKASSIQTTEFVQLTFWGQWSSFSACSVTCGSGFVRRERNCPIKGKCFGPERQTVICQRLPCNNRSEMIMWSQWTQFTPCSSTCGLGKSVRTRKCNYGTCDGPDSEVISCRKPACPIWTPWSAFDRCSVPCGGGVSTRRRLCMGRGSCYGEGSEERSCNTEPCEKLEIEPRARTEISACPSDECWRYNFALGKCEAVETCTRIVCGSESINIIFDKNLFGYANAQVHTHAWTGDGEVSWNGMAWVVDLPLRDQQPTLISTESMRFDFALEWDDSFEIPGKTKFLPNNHKNIESDSIKLAFSCFYPLKTTVKSNDIVFDNGAFKTIRDPCEGDKNCGDFSQGFKMILNGGSAEPVSVGDTVFAEVSWALDFEGVGFYFERCDVIEETESFSVIKEGCLANVVNTRFQSGPEKTGFSYDSFRFGSSSGYSGNAAIICTLNICSRTECLIPTEITQCPLSGDDIMFGYTPPGFL